MNSRHGTSCKHEGCPKKGYVTLEGFRRSYCQEHYQDYFNKQKVKSVE